MEHITAEEKKIVYQYLRAAYPITDEDFSTIFNYARKKSYKKGEYLLKQDEIETKTAFVLKGIVHQYILIDGNELVINISISGMSFNSYTSYAQESPSEQIQKAIKDVVIMYIEKEDVEELLKSNHAFCYIVYKKYELVHLEREIRAHILQHKSAKRKFELFMERETKAQRYLLEVPQKLIASYLGMTPESYSRVKKLYFQEN